MLAAGTHNAAQYCGMTDRLDRQDAPSKGSLQGTDRTALWILIDRSGSMRGWEGPVVRGITDLIDEQAELPGTCRLTLAQFDSEDTLDVICDSVRVQKADKGALDRYEPRAATPLYDAIGAIISKADKRSKRRAKSGKTPEDNVVVIVTDGMENASREYTSQQIHKLIKKRRKAGWAFIFLGANQDSYATGAAIGFTAANTQNYRQSAAGYDAVFTSTSRAIRGRRDRNTVGAAMVDEDLFEGVKEAEEELSVSA